MLVVDDDEAFAKVVADVLTQRGYSARCVSDSDEALAQMKAMEEKGSVHTIWTMMTPFIGAICNCSPEDCLAMLPLSRTDVEIMERAEHVARVDEALCTGCGACDAACHFKAVTSHQHHGQSHAHIDPSRCSGCGLCRGVCGSGAITLVPR